MPPAAEPRRWRKDRGAALLVAMLFVAIASGLALQLMTMWRADTTAVRGQLDAVQARAILRAAMDDVLARAVTRPGPRPFPPVATFDYAGARVRVTARSEAGKVNLNAAKPELIDALVKTLGFGQDLARTVGGAVVDWRDEDHQRSPTGAEDRDYENDNLPFGAADRPFVSPRELAYVGAVKPDIARALAPYVTVFSGTADPSPLVAAPAVRQALASVRRTVPQDDREKDKAEGENAAADQSSSSYTGSRAAAGATTTGGSFDAAEPATGQGSGGAAASSGVAGGDRTRTYTLWLDARLANGYVARARAVVWLHGGRNGAVYRVLDWAPYVMPGDQPA